MDAIDKIIYIVVGIAAAAFTIGYFNVELGLLILISSFWIGVGLAVGMGPHRKPRTPVNPPIKCPWCSSSNLTVVSQEVVGGSTQYELSCQDCPNGRPPFVVDVPTNGSATAVEGD